MAKWAQWCINHNMRYALYLLAVMYLPFAIVTYIAIHVMPEIWSGIVRDFRSIATVKKSRSK